MTDVLTEPHTFRVGDAVMLAGFANARTAPRFEVTAVFPNGDLAAWCDTLQRASVIAADCAVPAVPKLPKVPAHWGYEIDGRFTATVDGKRLDPDEYDYLANAGARRIRGIVIDVGQSDTRLNLHGLRLAVVCDADGTPLECDDTDDGDRYEWQDDDQ